LLLVQAYNTRTLDASTVTIPHVYMRICMAYVRNYHTQILGQLINRFLQL